MNLPMSFHLPVSSARPGSVVLRSSPVARFRRVYSGMSGVRHVLVGQPDVDRQGHGVIAHVGRVVAGRARAQDHGQAQGVVEAADPRDVDPGRAEQRGAAGDGRAVPVAGAGPVGVERHRVRVERQPVRIRPEDVVDRDVEGLHRRRRPALPGRRWASSSPTWWSLCWAVARFSSNRTMAAATSSGSGAAPCACPQGRVRSPGASGRRTGRRHSAEASRPDRIGVVPMGANDSRPSHITAVRKRRFVAGSGRRNSESSAALA